VRRLHRDGHLSGGAYRLHWTWPSGAQIALDTSPGEVTMVYRYRKADEWRDVRQRVTVVRTACHYGGARPWFLCPYCGRRVAILYLWNVPQCRRCARLVYSSQSLDALARSWRRTGKIEARLKGDAEEWDYTRPKGMRQATFERLVAAHIREEELRDEALLAFAARWMAELR
jgi:hypothetical protein